MTVTTPTNVVRRISLALVALVLVIAAVFGIRHMTRDDVFVRTARVNNDNIISSVATNGKVEPIQLFQAHADAPSQVKDVYVQAGQTVAAGTVLLRTDTADAASKIEAARASIASAAAAQHDMQQGGSQEERIALSGDLSRAQLQVDQNQRDLTALQQLQTRGAASASEVAAARDRLLVSQSSLASLQKRRTERYGSTDRARVAAQVQEGRANLNAAQDALANSVIRAPFAGTVFSLPVRRYDYVGAGEELVQVADLTRMQVLAYFDEPEIGKLRVNDPVMITWEARPGKRWHGHIVRVPTTVITYGGTRNVGECLIAVDDATGDLLPNTNVTARVTTQQVFNVLTLPHEALRTQQSGQTFVYLLRSGKLHKTIIEVGAFNPQSVQVVRGLSAGDVVALNTTTNVDLADGLAVQEAK